MEELEKMHKQLKEVYGELETTQTELQNCLHKLAKLKKKYQEETKTNSELRHQLKRLRHKVHKYKYLCKKERKSSPKTANIAIQTENLNNILEDKTQVAGARNTGENESINHLETNRVATTDSLTKTTYEPISLAESLKAAAEEAMHQTGYTYDERTGLYYDHNSGYYYDSERSLYYEPHSGTYFYFDPDTQSYQFHSQVDPAELAQYNADWTKDKERKRSSRKSSMPPSHHAPTPTTEVKIKHSVSAEKEDKNGKNRKNVPHPKSSNKKKKVALDDSFVPIREDDSRNLNEKHEDVADTHMEIGDKDSEESELEDGEVTSSSAGEEETEEVEEFVQDYSSVHYPPCIRAIVSESSTLQRGTLFVVTCTGATIGREEDLGHLILIPDTDISKMHCDIRYDEVLKRYVVKDHASQNGTFINGARLSEPKTLSEPFPVQNGFELRVGGTTLSLHIHAGSDTCDECEPGQIQAKLQAEVEEQEPTPKESKEAKEQQRRRQLKMIKKKFGLAEADYVANPEGTVLPGYQDRSCTRRRTKGSDNPYQPDDAPASVHRAISSDNRGHKLLAKMGWKEGEGLGKTLQGMAEPVQVNIRTSAVAGLGSSRNIACSMDSAHNVKATQILALTRERYQKLELEEAATGESTPRLPVKANITHTKMGEIKWHRSQTAHQVKVIPKVDLGANSDSGEDDEST